MYADTMKGHQPKGDKGNRDDYTFSFRRLADVWPTYFPEEAEVGLSESDQKVRLTTALADFFSTPEMAEVLRSRVEDDGNDILCLPIDFQQLQELRMFIEDKLNESPKEALLCMGVAAHLALCSDKDNKRNKINIRLYNTGAAIALKKLKAAFISKSLPVIIHVFLFYQIQELASADNHEEGRVPRTVECELTEDLVDCCIPGEIVTVTAIVKVLNNHMDVGGGKSRISSQGLYYLYLEAVSVRKLKSHAVSDKEIQASGICHSQSSTVNDDFAVKYKEKYGTDVFRRILQSFCPSIYGHELVKAGITLALFGGVQKNSMDQNMVPVRGDIHVIVVGDPGLGKSQLLQAAAAVSPRGIYVCGNTTTKAGLTVAVVKDSMTNDYAFEAGAMVLADRGICCIDEFDKMFTEHQALLEAMEQQCVSIAKAGLVASLSARTSVLAAANPIGGHYDRAKTVNENLKMSAALLSRFDLVFILLDKPDESLDKRVSDHIIALHTNDVDNFRPNKRTRTGSHFDGDPGLGVGGNSVASRLRLHPEKDKDFTPLSGQLLRKYISYSREHVFPRMSKAAAAILKEFYLKLRNRSASADGTPITARQLESLVRLAEARARVDLRDEVTEEDAQDVVDIMKESLYDKYVDEHGFVDFTRSGGMSQPKQAKKFLNALNKESELQQKDCFSRTELYTIADKISLQVPDLDTLVEKMNIAGYLIQKRSGMYQIHDQTSLTENVT
ncbi:minichromosome maintenance 8 [Zea mays]|uniref:DNA helicase n=1 Tax=Zea mays TaxID=4577 RepID=A0A1D6FS08_MAIZE|nr:minichromosome maintenance 8 [Zea mays]